MPLKGLLKKAYALKELLKAAYVLERTRRWPMSLDGLFYTVLALGKTADIDDNSRLLPVDEKVEINN